MGLLLAVVVHPANIQDRDGAKLVIDKLIGRFPRMRLVWADAGYAGKLVEWVWALDRLGARDCQAPQGQPPFSSAAAKMGGRTNIRVAQQVPSDEQEPAPYSIRGLRSSVRYNRGVDPHSYGSSHAPTLSTNLI